MAQAVLDPQIGKFTREFALGSTEILALFKSNSVITKIPFRPSGGDLFVYSSEDPLKIDDWKSDGHAWTNQGNKKPLPRTNPKYLKSYYYIKSNGKANKGFRKEVYFPINTGNIIIHYIGDESLSEMKPHGNSNKKEPFFRTKPSVRNEIQNKIEVEKPHIVQRWLTDNLPKQMERHWDADFIRYFKKAVEPKLGYFCAWSITDYCKLDPKNGITTNQSEGFNFLLKDFQNWKEVPLDSLLMSLKLIQGFYLEEIRRGKAQLGTFRLKPKYTRYVAYTERLKILGIPSLEYRRTRSDLIEVYKIMKGVDKVDKNKLFPTNLNPTQARTRGHRFKINKKLSKTNIRKVSFTQRIVNQWNKLPEDVVCTDSVNSFKSALNKTWKNNPVKFSPDCYRPEVGRREHNSEETGLRGASLQSASMDRILSEITAAEDGECEINHLYESYKLDQSSTVISMILFVDYIKHIFPNIKRFRRKSPGDTIYKGIYLNTSKFEPEQPVDFDNMKDYIPPSFQVASISNETIEIHQDSGCKCNGNTVFKVLSIYRNGTFDITISGTKVDLTKLHVDSSFQFNKKGLETVFAVLNSIRLCCGLKCNKTMILSKYRTLDNWTCAEESFRGMRALGCRRAVPINSKTSTCRVCQQQKILQKQENDNGKNNSDPEPVETTIKRLFPSAPMKIVAMLAEQAKNVGCTPKGRRWSKDFMDMCQQLYKRSPKCYELLKKSQILVLPSPSRLTLSQTNKK